MGPHQKDFFYLFTPSGVFKTFNLIVGGASYGLGVYSYDETTVQEEFFLRTVQTILTISAIYLSLYLLSTQKLTNSETNRAVDIGYHLTASGTLFVAGSLIIYSAVDNERTYCVIIYTLRPHHFCQYYGLKLGAGILTFVTGVLYVLTALTLFVEISNSRVGKEPQLIKNSSSRNSTSPRSFYYGQK